MFRREHIGLLAVTVAAIAPVILWALSIPFAHRFADGYTAALNVGQLTGLVGIACFALSLVLSARIPFFEPYFGGMNRVYAIHHILGGLSFIFLMIHPVSLAIARIDQSWMAAAGLLLPGGDWIINIGIASLLSLMALLIMTYYSDLPYELWRYTHKFLGVAFVIGAIHSLFIESDITSYAPLRAYILGLVALGTVAYIYRTVLGKLLIRTYRYRVSKVHQPASDIVEIILVPDGKRVMNFVPGQFAFITFMVPGKSQESHPFSISTPPMRKGFRISVKILGDYTAWLPNIAVGTEARVEGPYGRFSYAYNHERSDIWVGGGIGITPFVSMAYSLEPGRLRADVYYCTATKEEAVYLPAFEEVMADNPDIRIVSWFSKEKGRISAEAIAKESGDIKNKDIYVCGPPVMMHALVKQFKALGVAKGKIHTEEFGMV